MDTVKFLNYILFDYLTRPEWCKYCGYGKIINDEVHSCYFTSFILGRVFCKFINKGKINKLEYEVHRICENDFT